MDIVPYLVLFAVVFGVNLLPAFGPPTWAILVLYGLNSHLPVWAIVPIAAVAAASARFLLAHAFRLLGNRVPAKMRRNLTSAREALERHPRSGLVALAVFAFSPLPSAQLFEAAGLTGVKLLRFTAAFFLGRLGSYSIYAGGAAGIRHSSFGDTVRESLTSPWGIAAQVAMIAGLVALTQIDWDKLLKRAKK